MANSEAREKVLQAAEKLFVERGYESVKVMDIAEAAGIHHASIYHHLPKKGGKASLYVEVMTRNAERHRQGIDDAIQQGDGNLRQQLHHIATWLLSQPPVDAVRMVNSDLRAIPAADADKLSDLMFEVTLMPLYDVLAAAQARGEIHHPNLGNIAGAIFSAIEGLHSIPDTYVQGSREAMAGEIIDVFIQGMKAQ